MSDQLAPAADAASDDPLLAGREALARHAWQEAFDRLSEADRAGGLSGADLEALAMSAFFIARADLEIETKERAFKAYQAEGDLLRAAYLALDLSKQHAYRGRTSIAGAWLRRAERLLEGLPEAYAHGYLALERSELARKGGDVEAAVAQAELAVEIAGRTGDGDLLANAMTALGALKIATGYPTDGLALLEEASVAAINGELSPFTTGVTCCTMIAACRDLTDYRRASEWTEATEKWCERQAVSGFPGVCRVHRAEVVALSGAWERAEQELRRATDELAAYNAIPPLADGWYAIGEIRRLKGDLAGAEAALREAHALGRTPQPALALIRLAEGKVRSAASAIIAAVRDETWDQWARVRLLPAQVEIAIAAGDRPTARAAAEELTRIVESFRAPALDAGRQQTWGRVHLAEGDPAGAVRELRAAIRSWREVGAPYEVARSRVLLSRALRALEDDDEADLELQAARAEFERLGATTDLRSTELEVESAAGLRRAPLQARRTFMFTDIVGSTNLAELLGNEAWEQLLRWHDDMLRRVVAGAGGEIVNSTGDGFFVAFEGARPALECAVAIQRRLAEQRQSSGFALSVRIGLHAAEANRRVDAGGGVDYSGVGVNLAARVAGLAGGGEILVTTETLDQVEGLDRLEGIAPSASREAVIRGVSTPVSVVTVAWS
ncbi:MAG TPA: adenylate/guanylate cyclase domain-containing protein [Candidatus Limnocylindrales bacterium]|nr:adenylate/guanylate cyclase domain-containing protein [Candidatus Limnocylindrales bacterium]